MTRVKAVPVALILLMMGYVYLYTSLSRKPVPCSTVQQQIQTPQPQPQQIAPPLANIVRKDVSLQGYSHEILRRRSLNLVKEMRYTVQTKLKAWKADGQPFAVDVVSKLLEDFSDMANYLEANLEGLGRVDGAGEAQRTALQLLSETFTESIRSNQEPADCQKSKFLVVDINKACGFGCQLHHVVNCFFLAYGSNRVLQLSTNNWVYTKEGFSSVFQPLSSCPFTISEKPIEWDSPDSESSRYVHCPIVEQMHKKPPFAPTAVPASIAAELHRLHGAPNVWVVGHFLAYLMRLQLGEVLSLSNTALAAVHGKVAGDGHFEPNQYPVVGLHIRRTDKINSEAAFHSLKEYMFYANQYFDKFDAQRLLMNRIHEWKSDNIAQQFSQKPSPRRIFIASDDPNVFDEARKSYPDYEFIGDVKRAKSASTSSRYSHVSLLAVITDVITLSHTDFIVCTFSSQICRLSYELMQTRALKLGDASALVQSLDDVYYYGGAQYWQVETIIPDKKANLEVGDLVDYLGNHWNGEAKITHKGRTDLVPAYKFDYRVQSIPFGPASLLPPDAKNDRPMRALSKD